MPVNNKIQIRRGTYSEWDAQATGILASGEPGYITNFNKLKVGDGSTEWSDLTAVNDNITTIVINKTANTIPKMSVVYINGAQGDLPTIALSIASGEVTSSKTYGLTATDIAPDAIGLVVVDGALKKLNTLTQFSGVSLGTVLYLSPSVSGGITTTKPLSPNHLVSIGNLVRIHNQQGVISVKIQNGYELGELHNVSTNGSEDNGKFLQYNSTSGVWLASSSGNFTTLQLNGTGVVAGTDGTVNYISKFNNSNTITNSIIYDNGTNVGIGTINPSSKLQVSGLVTFNSGLITNNLNLGSAPFGISPLLFIQASDASSITSSFRIDNTSYQPIIDARNDGNIAIGSISGPGLTHRLSIRGSNNDSTRAALSVSNSGASTLLHVRNDGNIGVGTTTPSAQLHVIGTGIFSNDLTVGGNLTVNGSVVTANVDRMEIEDPILTLGLASGNIVTTDTLDRGLALVRSTGLTAFMGWDSSATQFVMLSSGVASNSSGNYDAGTYGNLQINNLNASSGNFSSNLTVNNTGVSLSGHSHSVSNITDFNSGVSGLLPTIANSGDNRILTSTGSTVGINAESNLTFDGNLLNVTGSGSFSRNIVASGFVLSPLPPGNTTNSLLTAGGSAVDQGSLAVSSAGYASSANVATHLNGGVAGSIPYQSSANTTTFVSIGSSGRFLTSNGSAPVWTANPVTGTGVANHIAYWNSSSGIIADSGQLYWDSTNNRLGIGTSSPGTTLDIRGSAVFNEDGANNDFRIEGDTDSNLFFVDASADSIGIGTNSPNAKLAISAGGAGGTILGAAQSQPFQINDATAADYINLAHFNVSNAASRGSFTLSNNSSSAWENNVMQFFVHGTGYQHGYYGGNTNDAGCAMIVTQGSNIAKLQIGNISSVPIEFFTANSLALKIKADHDFDFYKEIYDPNESGVVLKFHNKTDDIGELAAIAAGTDSTGNDAGKLRFFTGPANSTSERMCINSVGGVGIGTSTPSVKLDVVGDVNIDGNLTFDSFTESVVSNGNSGTSKTLSLTSGTVHTCTLTGNCTFTMPTATAGKSFTMFLNTGSGNYTASFSGVRWADSAIPTATILASKVDIYSFISDGSYWYGSFSQNYG